jgi:hypothetical protein
MHEPIVKTLKPTNEVQETILKYSESPPWFIEISLGELPTKRYEGTDLFECLCNLRKQLDKLGIKILCNGSRIDTHPSRMSRDMGGARKVYQLTMGQQGRLEDLVDIFAEAPAEKVGTVEEQKAFYSRWLDSLG